jgi:site-specific DNA recombinase
MPEIAERVRPLITSRKPIGKAARRKAPKPSLYEQADVPRRAAIYVRVSTMEQAQGFSTNAQERICREFVIRQKPNWTVTQVFRDEGYSGKNDKRPGFQSMLQAVEDGKINAIVCHHLDRYSRNLHDIMVYFKRMEDQRVYLSFAEEQFDFSTPEGRMHFNILAVFADWYLKNLSRETKKGKSSVVLTGRQNNQLPFGYTKTEDKTIQIVSDEAEAIREAFENYATGNYTDSQLASNLNNKGFTTRKGRRWTKESIRVMLHLDFYYGVVKYQDDLYQGKHEPIISKDIFDQVQRVRRNHAQSPRTFSRKMRIYLLNGLARCNACGRNLRAQANKGGNRYYREVSHMRGYSCPDERTSIIADDLESQIGEIIQGFELPDDWQQEIRDALDSGEEFKTIAEERTIVEEKLKRLGELYLDGMLERPAYLVKRDKLKRQLSTLIVPEPQTLLEVGQQIESFKHIWSQADESQQREMCHIMFEGMKVNMQQRKLVRVMPRSEFRHFFDRSPYLEHDEETGEYVVRR